MDDEAARRSYLGRTWLTPTVVGAAVLALLSGYGQFGVTTVLGEVAEVFGHATERRGVTAAVGLSTTTLGIGLAVVRLAGLGALPVASLADRVGRRPVLWTCAAGLALTVLAATMPSFWPFVVVVALARPLLAGTNAVATVVAAEAVDTAGRARALAVAEAGYAVGAGLVAVVHGSGLLDFRGVLGLAALLAVVFPWLVRHMRESHLFEQVSAASAADPRLGIARARLGSVDAAVRGRLMLIAVLTALIALVTGPGFTFLFVYGENVLGVSPGFMAVLVVVAGVLGLPGLLLGRWAADRLGRRVTAGAATVLVAVCTWVTYSGGVTALAVGYVSAVALSGAFGPAAGALTTEVFPTRDRSTASGWAAVAGVLGAVTGLLAFGLLVEEVDSFAVAGALLWLPLIPLAGLYALLPETRERELEELDRTTD